MTRFSVRDQIGLYIDNSGRLAGTMRVTEMLAQSDKGVAWELDEWVEDIPYRETRRYVKAVVGAWSAYRILAGGTAPRLAETVRAPKSGANF